MNPLKLKHLVCTSLDANNSAAERVDKILIVIDEHLLPPPITTLNDHARICLEIHQLIIF